MNETGHRMFENPISTVSGTVCEELEGDVLLGMDSEAAKTHASPSLSLPSSVASGCKLSSCQHAPCYDDHELTL